MVQGNSKIRVLIADNQPIFRQGLRSSLNQVEDIEICAEATTEQELLSALSTSYPDLILLDSELASQDGFELARTVKKQMPSVAVVLLTSETKEEELFEAIKARASAYLSRTIETDVLVKTIRRAAAGEHPINETLFSQPKVAVKLLEQFQDLSWGRGVETYISPLTPRETEILTYMARGYLNKQIADALSISEQTIKNHITSILRKLDANARTQAVVIAVKRGLISLG